MPMIDMPLEQLRTYRGINPKPSDYDEYWDRALNELKETDPEVSITESEFQSPGAECFDLYFTGVKGGRIYAKLLKPEHINGTAPAVLMFHGYGASSGNWSQYLWLVANGFVVAALDCRGQGGKSEDLNPVSGTTLQRQIVRGMADSDPDNLYFRQVFLDTVALSHIVMDLDYVDETRVATMGGSQGGALSLVCAALEPRIAKIATAYPFLSDYKRVWEMDRATGSYGDLHAYLRNYDPLHENEEEFFTKLGYIDIRHIVHRIKGDVLMAVGLMDSVCLPSTSFAVYNHIEAKKDILIYPDYGHEILPGLNDRRLLFLKDLL